MTRLADVARPAGPALFSPLVRPRITERIDVAAAGRIILIVAPAGYGKSLALSHWLERQSRQHLRFDVQPEHNTLLGFARGIAEAFAQFPALRKTVSSASQNCASASEPGREMARWMAAHLEGFDGIIALDDFHRASDDVEVSRFVAALIARTKAHVQWAVSTRSTLDLPVASWLAYGDAHFVIGDRDLTFRDEEVLELSGVLGHELSPQALRGVMDATSGWPVALGLALRSSVILNGGAHLSHATREVLFRYLAEQVYAGLSAEGRELLHFAAYLPAIDVSVLETAGYHTCARILEAARRRETFLSLESPGRYKFHDLFGDFLRGQLEVSDPPEAKRLKHRAAEALERSGDVIAALRLYAQLRAADDVLRLLHTSGFDLMDHSHGDVVETALQAVPADVRSTDPIVLGLRAQRAADSGHFERAEALFRSALATKIDADVTAMLSLKLSIMLVNEGRPVSHLLEPLMDEAASTGLRAEIFGLLSTDYSNRGASGRAEGAMREAGRLCTLLDDQGVIAKVNLRSSVTAMNIGRPCAEVRRAALSAAETAERAGLLMLAGRASTVLATISLCLENNLERHVHYAELAKAQSMQSGDRENLEAALLQLACAETQIGDRNRLSRLLRELSEIGGTPWHEGTLESLQALIFVWDGDLEKAERQMSSFRGRGYSYYAFDKVADMALHAMLCVAIGNHAKGLSICGETRSALKNVGIPHLYARSQCEIAIVLCGITQTIAHCLTGRRHDSWTTVLPPVETPAAILLNEAHDVLRLSIKSGDFETVSAALQELHPLNLTGLSRTISTCIEAGLTHRRGQRIEGATLTSSELEVMTCVGKGLSTKEIASQRGRSVHTIRTLIQRAIAKLGCTGRYEAVEALRSRGVLHS